MSSIKKNFIYNALYNILTLIIPLITTPYISRVLGAENIGIYSYAYSIASYFGLFILLGINNYGNRTIARIRDDKEKISKTFSSIYSMQLILGFIVNLFYFFYILFFAENKLMAFILDLYLISLMLDINWFYFGIEQFKLTVTRNTIIKILNTILLFVFVKSPNDIYIYALIMVVGIVISQVILWSMLNKFVIFVKPKLDDILVHIKPNLILFIPVIAISIYNTMDKIMLGVMSDMIQVGYYESSFKLTTIPVMAITSLGTVMLPRMSNLIAGGNHEQARKYIQKSLVLSIFLAAPMSFGLSGICREFVPLFYGPGYEMCMYLIPILVTASIFVSWANVIRTQYLIPNKQDKDYIISVILGAIINVLVNLILIPQLQSLGAAIGTLFAEMVVSVYQTIRVRKKIEVYKYFKQSFPFIIFSILMFFIVFNIPIINTLILTLCIKISVGGIVYALCSLLYLKKLF